MLRPLVAVVIITAVKEEVRGKRYKQQESQHWRVGNGESGHKESRVLSPRRPLLVTSVKPKVNVIFNFVMAQIVLVP